MYSDIAKSVFNDHLVSSNDPCNIQNRVITNHVIKRLRCIFFTRIQFSYKMGDKFRQEKLFFHEKSIHDIIIISLPVLCIW